MQNIRANTVVDAGHTCWQRKCCGHQPLGDRRDEGRTDCVAELEIYPPSRLVLKPTVCTDRCSWSPWGGNGSGPAPTSSAPPVGRSHLLPPGAGRPKHKGLREAHQPSALARTVEPRRPGIADRLVVRGYELGIPAEATLVIRHQRPALQPQHRKDYQEGWLRKSFLGRTTGSASTATSWARVRVYWAAAPPRRARPAAAAGQTLAPLDGRQPDEHGVHRIDLTAERDPTQ